LKDLFILIFANYCLLIHEDVFVYHAFFLNDINQVTIYI